MRLPHRSLQVLSLSAPIIGWTSRPVIGPARFRMGRSWGSAPIIWNSGFTAVCCKPKLNWMPKNPKFITSIAPILIGGRVRSDVVSESPPVDVIVPVCMKPPLVCLRSRGHSCVTHVTNLQS